MVMNLPIKLYPGRLKVLLLLSGSILFIAAGIWASYADHTGSYILNGLVVACVAIYFVFPQVTSLYMSANGFKILTPFKAYSVLWSDIAEFSTAPYGKGKVVLLKYTQSYKENSRAPSPLTTFTTRRFRISRMNEAWAGCDAALPDNYGMDADHLASLMNELRKMSVAV